MGCCVFTFMRTSLLSLWEYFFCCKHYMTNSSCHAWLPEFPVLVFIFQWNEPQMASFLFPRWKLYFWSEGLPQQVWVCCQQQLSPALAEIQSLSQVHLSTGWICGQLVGAWIKHGTPGSQDDLPILGSNMHEIRNEVLHMSWETISLKN